MLILASRAGEAWAKEALFRRYAPLVNGLSFRLLGSDADLDDLVQEVFAEALSSLARLRNTETFASWISAIVVRTTNKLLRRRRLMTKFGLRRAEPINWDQVQSRTAPPDVAFEIRVLYRVVENMHPKLRIPLVLRHLEDASLEEISELTGVSLATVKRRLLSAQEELDAALERKPRKSHA